MSGLYNVNKGFIRGFTAPIFELNITLKEVDQCIRNFPLLCVNNNIFFYESVLAKIITKSSVTL